jgi:hypothetical protein
MRHISHITIPWPVWRDSTTAPVRFCPLSKKEAVKLFHKAREFERQTRLPGKQDGALGRNGLAILHVLIFDCLNYQTGRLDPSQKTIARKAGISERSVGRGLVKLKDAGVLTWLRRAGETRDKQGRFCLKQDTNAYGLLPPSQWRGFIERNEPPPPSPDTWGATPPLPDVLTQAITHIQQGNQQATLDMLEADPNDSLAMALAGLKRAMDSREASPSDRLASLTKNP